MNWPSCSASIASFLQWLINWCQHACALRHSQNMCSNVSLTPLQPASFLQLLSLPLSS
ncbi:hypothetical protein PR003_g1802 [Phytophthora rubi]|uniref:Uncharacterized protein n=1 Tax=Phytophthora rubi TaxID=129364 RepID=A0A6A3P2A4_9STRA|nr:hypothetical protein PR002_g1860 [Phytophthora rubi]KAE9051117.1 hypothetical protein PR001_g1748 [Phytophthora rubi]KAE9357447.1 hypothetical protein PR003_g1802 [Phytophthora rubi]